MLYPERRGQPKGKLDWGIVLLDGLGLLLFFVPGVIAFIVDFATGTIYLPPEQQAGIPQEGKEHTLTEIQLPPGPVTRESIELAVSRHLSQPVRLQPGQYRTESLSSVDQYWPSVQRLAGETA